MSSRGHHRARKRGSPLGVRVFHANVGRGGPAHDIALHLGFFEGAEVISIVEPWVDTEHRATKTHPGYDLFAPCDSWSPRPRVFIYVRKGGGRRPVQTLFNVSPDLTAVQIQGPSGPVSVWGVYNAPTGSERQGEGLEALLHRQASPSCLVVGDLNHRHSDWDPSARSDTPAARRLAEWIEANGLRVLNPGVQTQRGGGVLDLALSNDPEASAEVAHHLNATSDHESLLAFLPGGSPPQPVPGRLQHSRCDLKRLRELLQPHCATLAPDDPEAEASDLVKTISLAMEGATPRGRLQAQGSRWWNDECRGARRAFQAALRVGPAEEERKEFRRVVRRAKRSHFCERVNQAASLREVYEVVRWHKHTVRQQTPPLQSDAGPVAHPDQKAELLRATLLDRQLDATDVDPDAAPLPVPPRRIAWSPISQEEARRSVCQTKSSTPGIDEIPVAVLTEVWPYMGNRITALFQSCVRAQVHPTAFKQAEVVILPKPGKRDRALPKSYRPIALLSCLGKGLERLQARRIAYLALQTRILAEDQCGAISKRSATDLTTALASDVEEAWADKKVAGVVTVDVKGAFDGILHGRLARRLLEQGWPPEVVGWVRSFCAGRQARIRLDGYTSAPFPLQCGLPQGSPVSPILFLLYMAPLIRLTGGRFGYADDAAILKTASSMEGCHRALQDAVDLTLRWGLENGVRFDLLKTELQYFHRRRRGAELPLDVGGVLVKPNNCTRWLGVFFDQKLLFREHVAQAVVRAKGVVAHVNRLARTTWGPRTDLARQAVQGCAFATLLYGAETWYSRRTPQGRVERIQVAINDAARAVLPVYCTTQRAALLRETGWGPARAWLDRIIDRMSVRVAGADAAHPLRRRWDKGRMQWARRRVDPQLADWTLVPPWEPADRDQARQAIGAVGREAGPVCFLRWLERATPSQLVVFSDGSKDPQSRAGAGFAIYFGTREMGCGKIPLGELAEVYDAEVSGATEGLRAALAHPLARIASGVTVCLDNEEVALRLHLKQPTASSFPAFREFWDLSEQWSSRSTARPGGGGVAIRWCPAHAGIPGNELADKLAKEACGMPPPPGLLLTVSRARHTVEELYEAAVAAHWAAEAPAQYRELRVEARSRLPKELHLPRRELGRLLASRSGHGDFAEYHRRFNHDDALLECSCGSEKERFHFFFCRLASRPDAPGFSGMAAVRWLLGTDQGAERFAKWCRESQFYQRTCTRSLGIEVGDESRADAVES